MIGDAARPRIVIPTLNEAEQLPGILGDVGRLRVEYDVVVVDGGSHDGTVEVARSFGARVITAPRGRGGQLNAGALGAGAEWLCFLHGDVRMPEAARLTLERALDDPGVAAAVWRLSIDARGGWFRVIEFGARIRDGLGGLPYGDQGLLVRRRLYETVGGFPEIPVMEDVAMVRAIRRCASVRRFEAPLVVSARRWLREGPYRTWFRNMGLLTAYLAGVSPHRLERWYRPESR